MAAGVNKVILVATLGKDPEIKYTQSGQAICSLAVATSERWKDKNGDPQERTEWHRVKAWGKLGELCGEHLQKGRQVYIEGKISTSKYQAKDGTDRYSTEVVAQTVQFLGAKGDKQGQSDKPQTYVPQGPKGNAPAYDYAESRAHSPGHDYAAAEGLKEEDVPF